MDIAILVLASVAAVSSLSTAVLLGLAYRAVKKLNDILG